MTRIDMPASAGPAQPASSGVFAADRARFAPSTPNAKAKTFVLSLAACVVALPLLAILAITVLGTTAPDPIAGIAMERLTLSGERESVAEGTASIVVAEAWSERPSTLDAGSSFVVDELSTENFTANVTIASGTARSPFVDLELLMNEEIDLFRSVATSVTVLNAETRNIDGEAVYVAELAATFDGLDVRVLSTLHLADSARYTTATLSTEDHVFPDSDLVEEHLLSVRAN